MKKTISITLAICLMLTVLAGCGGNTAQPGGTSVKNSSTESSGGGGGKAQYISMGTGAVTGVYYPLGGAMANLISKHIDGYSCTAESTGGAVENCKLIANGNLEMGFVAASTLYDAQKGINAFEGGATENVLAVFSFYPEVVQILSTNENIRTIPDLKDKRIAVGAAGSGTETMARAVLEVYGMSYDDIKEDFLGFGDAADGLKDQNIDAAFTWAGIPTSSVMDLGSQHGISMITFTDEELAILQEGFPYCVPAAITKDHYPSLYEEAQTFSIPAVIACSAEMSEEFVYDFLVTIFDNLDVLVQTHERGGDLSLETVLDGLQGVKLHPGAEKFFKEKGVL